MIKILEPEAFAFHMDCNNSAPDPLPIDTQISDNQEPKLINKARAIPTFAKVANEEIKMICEFNTFTLVPREAVPPGITNGCLLEVHVCQEDVK